MVQTAYKANYLVHDHQWLWIFKCASLLSKLEQVFLDPFLVLQCSRGFHFLSSIHDCQFFGTFLRWLDFILG